METLATLTDKLVIEVIKIIRLRDKLDNDVSLTDKEKIELFNVIETANKQRNDFCKELDEIVEDWLTGKKIPKTYKRIKF